MLKDTIELLKCEIADLEEENIKLREQVEELKKQVCYTQGVAYAEMKENELLRDLLRWYIKKDKTFKS